MELISASFPGTILVKPRLYGDERGFFMETYRAYQLAGAGIPAAFAQDNHPSPRQGILRGLHYQIQLPQGKLVRALAGEVHNVAVVNNEI
jgi:dTDP-4-dehydrorhamnose 3,5-epimerase